MRYLFVLLMITSFRLEAKVLPLKKNSGTIYVEENPTWQLNRDLFGIPFIFFSPQTNGQRSNISFTHTNVTLDLEFKTLKETQGDFHKGKKTWAESVGANILSFNPYSLQVNNNGHRVHKIGLNYEHEGEAYVEHSYYIECKGKLLFSKSLRLAKNADHEKDFAQYISSVDCGGL